ncbi:MAG: hypothetical protein FWD31_13680 [Planctomycetaceae bacterium]|nr:hypothetical protein [Planctomycetaceae bacterium]
MADLEAKVGGECVCYYASGSTTPPLTGTSSVLEHITDLNVESSRESIDTSTRATYPDKTSKPAGKTNTVSFTLMNWQDPATKAVAPDVQFIRDAYENTSLISLAVLDGPGGNGSIITGYILDDQESQGLNDPNTWAMKLEGAAPRKRVEKGVITGS